MSSSFGRKLLCWSAPLVMILVCACVGSFVLFFQSASDCWFVIGVFSLLFITAIVSFDIVVMEACK